MTIYPYGSVDYLFYGPFTVYSGTKRLRIHSDLVCPIFDAHRLAFVSHQVIPPSVPTLSKSSRPTTVGLTVITAVIPSLER